MAQVQVLVTVVSASARAVAGADAVHDMTRPMDDGRWRCHTVLCCTECIAWQYYCATVHWTGLDFTVYSNTTPSLPLLYIRYSTRTRTGHYSCSTRMHSNTHSRYWSGMPSILFQYTVALPHGICNNALETMLLTNHTVYSRQSKTRHATVPHVPSCITGLTGLTSLTDCTSKNTA